jgi:hypothetical protein
MAYDDATEPTEQDPDGEGEGDDDGEEEIAPDSVEIDIDGEKVRVPAKFKDAYMRHADYTRKTQEVAEQLRTFEAEREAYTERQKIEAAVGEKYQDLRVIEKELSEFRNLDWSRLQNDDPNLAQTMLFRFNMLKDQRDVVEREVAAGAAEVRGRMERERADRIAKNNAALSANMPDWNDTKATEVRKFGKQLGFGEKEIETAIGNDWKIAKVLDLARIGQQVLEQRNKPKKARLVESNVEPLPKVKGRASRNVGPTDKDPTDKWMRARNKQVGSG